MKDGVLQVKDLANIRFSFKFVETLFFNSDNVIRSFCNQPHCCTCVDDLKSNIKKIRFIDNVLDYFIVEINKDTLKVSPTVKYKDIVLKDKEYDITRLKQQRDVLNNEVEKLEKEIVKLKED